MKLSRLFALHTHTHTHTHTHIHTHTPFEMCNKNVSTAFYKNKCSNLCIPASCKSYCWYSN